MRNELKAALALGLLLGTGTLANAGTLDDVKARGTLICGTNPGTAGFSMPDNNGTWTGFVVDYCRAVATAVLGDPTSTGAA